MPETGRGPGSEFYEDTTHERIVKIGCDPAYNVFVDWAQKNPLPGLPVFYSHQEFPTSHLDFYFTVTEMESLDSLDTNEESGWDAWLNERNTFITAQRTTKGFTSDPFGALTLINQLESVMRQAYDNEGEINGMELKPSDVMVRNIDGNRQYVIIDPFN